VGVLGFEEIASPQAVFCCACYFCWCGCVWFGRGGYSSLFALFIAARSSASFFIVLSSWNLRWGGRRIASLSFANFWMCSVAAVRPFIVIDSCCSGKTDTLTIAVRAWSLISILVMVIMPRMRGSARRRWKMSARTLLRLAAVLSGW